MSRDDQGHRERVEAFVDGMQPRAACGRCVAAALGMRTSAVHRVAMMLEGIPSYVRENGACALCGQRRLVVRALGAARRGS